MNHPLDKLKISLLVLVLFAALSLLFTFPGILHFSGKIIGEDSKDSLQYVAFQNLFARQVTHFIYPFSHTDFWRYPVGFDFSRGFDSYLAVALGGMLNVFLGATLAYNTTLILFMSANALISYFFFKKITSSTILGIAGALIYGLSFYALGKAASHTNLVFIGGFPLLASSILNLIQKAKLSKKDFLFFFGALLLIALSSLEYFLFALIILLVGSIVGYLIYKQNFISFLVKIVDEKQNLMIALIIFTAVFALFFLSSIAAIINGTFTTFARPHDLYLFTPSLKDYIYPNPYFPLIVGKIFSNTTFASIERSVFLGWAEIIFFIAFFFSKVKKSVKIFCGTLFVIFLFLSMGYGKDDSLFFLPYHFLQNIFPFNSVVETGRFMLIGYFFLTLGVVLFLKSIENPRLKNWLIGILIVAAIFERLPSGFYTADNWSNKTFIKVVQKQDSKAVLDLPVKLDYAPYDLLSTYYDKPIVNGYFHWSADGPVEQSFIRNNFINRYICSASDPILNGINNASESQEDTAMINALKSNGINTIVIHKDDKFYYTECTNIRERLTRLMPFTQEAKPTTGDLEKKIDGVSLSGNATFNIYLPSNGTFYIDGVALDPSSKTHFSITLNGAPIPTSYSWNATNNKNATELSPKYAINFPVNGGSTVSFTSDTQIDNASFGIWYRYIAADQSYIPYTPSFTKVFEDADASVYKIN